MAEDERLQALGQSAREELARRAAAGQRTAREVHQAFEKLIADFEESVREAE